MKKLMFHIIPILIILTVGCNSMQNQSAKNENNNEEQPETMAEPTGKIKLTKMTDSPKFPDAMLKRIGQSANPENKNEITFEFEVSNYELKKQTSDAANKGIAKSDKGQHIHFILNDGPYHAEYEPKFTMDLEDGHYVALAFLARSYHESVKTSTACQVWEFNVGPGKATQTFDAKKPHLFYSRPKGTYKGEDTKKVMLDFYLTNVSLSPDGYKVRATINGEEFTLTDWVPYLIEGLPMGENTIKLELLDPNGNLVDSRFNPVERTITLKSGGHA